MTVTRDEVEARLEYHKKRLQDAAYDRAAFRHTNLVGADFQGLDLRGVSFKDAALGHTYFIDANLYGVDLSDLDLRNCIFNSANLSHAVLDRSNINGSDFRLARLVGVDFRRTNIGRIVLRGAHLEMSRGLPYVQVSWTGFGERDRLLTYAMLEWKWVFFCGCFTGGYRELEEWVANREHSLKPSRMAAINFCRERAREIDPNYKDA